MLKCFTKHCANPWNQFVSDFDHWKVKSEGQNLCPEGTKDFFTNPETHHPGWVVKEFRKFLHAGAQVVWTEDENGTEIELMGSPHF